MIPARLVTGFDGYQTTRGRTFAITQKAGIAVTQRNSSGAAIHGAAAIARGEMI
jgi:hypothetical protein